MNHCIFEDNRHTILGITISVSMLLSKLLIKFCQLYTSISGPLSYSYPEAGGNVQLQIYVCFSCLGAQVFNSQCVLFAVLNKMSTALPKFKVNTLPSALFPNV